MRQLIPLVTGFVTIYGIKLAGDKRWQGWAVGLANQVPWLAFIIAFDAWGLLPLNVFLAVMYYRNLRKWRREERVAAHLKSVQWDVTGLPVFVNEHVPTDTAYFLNRAALDFPLPWLPPYPSVVVNDKTWDEMKDVMP